MPENDFNAKLRQPRNPTEVLRQERTPIFSVVEGAEAKIQAKFDTLGGEAALGPRVEHSRGSIWKFGGSAIVYDDKTDAACEIHGGIYQRWLEAGGLAFGTPCTDESSTPDGIGRYNHFNGNTASIYWTPATGAHTIYGGIRSRWGELGWERSYLGYPVSDEVAFADGGRANEFQNGGIYWWPDTGPIDLRDVVVHYTGIYCFGETDWDQSSSADEPYVIFAMTTPSAAWGATSQTYEGVDGGESRPDVLELYRGRPYGLNIGVVLMESDFGDPNKYRDQVIGVVSGVHAAGTLALGLIPVVGPVIAAIAGPALGKLMPELGGALSDAFDWGDDRIGSTTVTLSARDLVLLAARTGNSEFAGIGFKRETELISGEGASYKVYFGVIPA